MLTPVKKWLNARIGEDALVEMVNGRLDRCLSAYMLI
jgi:hypothetical protein